MYNQIAVKNVNITNKEILRYLGYNNQEVSDKLKHDIARCRNIISKNCTPRFVCADFKLNRTERGILLESTDVILTGENIKNLLQNSNKCVLMAATIGNEAERLIKYQQTISITDGVIMDAAATASIEYVCDEIERQLRQIHPITQRYSCGYGDLPIEIQPKMLSALNAQKTIGLFCNAAGMMIPQKSVTAVMGISY